VPDRGDAAPYASDRNYWIIKQHGFQGAYWFHHLGADPNARDRYVDHPWYGADSKLDL
jgi:hypothetical protein